jgi:hypothetical protein
MKKKKKALKKNIISGPAKKVFTVAIKKPSKFIKNKAVEFGSATADVAKKGFKSTVRTAKAIDKRFDESFPTTGKVLDTAVNIPFVPGTAEAKILVKGIGGGALKLKDKIKGKK